MHSIAEARVEQGLRMKVKSDKEDWEISLFEFAPYDAALILGTHVTKAQYDIQIGRAHV